MKYFRCGYCGQPINENGDPLTIDEINAASVDWNTTELNHGNCCLQSQAEEQSRTVTREMAMDACDPSLEGSKY